MKIIFYTILTLLVMLAPDASADFPEHTILYTTGKITIDGILDEEDWAQAPSFSPFQFP